MPPDSGHFCFCTNVYQAQKQTGKREIASPDIFKNIRPMRSLRIATSYLILSTPKKSAGCGTDVHQSMMFFASQALQRSCKTGSHNQPRTYCGDQKMAPHVNEWSPLYGVHA